MKRHKNTSLNYSQVDEEKKKKRKNRKRKKTRKELDESAEQKQWRTVLQLRNLVMKVLQDQTFTFILG